MVRRKKETPRHRRLDDGEEERLLSAAEPHLQAVIIAALETCCRQGELLTLRWADVSLDRGEIILRAEHTKDRENRIIPISDRLRALLEMRNTSRADVAFPPTAHVFGDAVGERVGSVRRAWQTALLRAHGQKPVWVWRKKVGPNEKGSTRLSPASEAAYRAINLHFHDLRHEAGSRLVEAGWPVHQCSTCWAMRPCSRPARTSTPRCAASTNRCERSISPARLASSLQAHPSADTGLFASQLPPRTTTPYCTEC